MRRDDKVRDARARGRIFCFHDGVDRAKQLAVRKDSLIHPVIIGVEELELLFSECVAERRRAVGLFSRRKRQSVHFGIDDDIRQAQRRRCAVQR